MGKNPIWVLRIWLTLKHGKGRSEIRWTIKFNFNWVFTTPAWSPGKKLIKIKKLPGVIRSISLVKPMNKVEVKMTANVSSNSKMVRGCGPVVKNIIMVDVPWQMRWWVNLLYRSKPIGNKCPDWPATVEVYPHPPFCQTPTWLEYSFTPGQQVLPSCWFGATIGGAFSLLLCVPGLTRWNDALHTGIFYHSFSGDKPSWGEGLQGRYGRASELDVLPTRVFSVPNLTRAGFWLGHIRRAWSEEPFSCGAELWVKCCECSKGKKPKWVVICWFVDSAFREV